MSVTIFNITKNCVGSTVLAAPDALQFAGGVPTFLSIMVVNIVLHTCTYALITLSCARTGARNYREWWLAVNGSRGVLLLDVLLFANGLTSLIAYVILIGDFLTKSFEGLLPGVEPLQNRTVNVCLATLVALLPLSLLRDLTSLVHASKLGLLCALYGAVFVTAGYFAAEHRSLSDSLGSAAFITANMEPASAAGILIAAAGSEVLTPRLFAELKDGTPMRYTTASFIAELLAHCFYVAFGLMGYARFGASPPRHDGNVLANYSQGTNWELFAWLSMAVNTVGMYPLQLAPVRDSAIGIARRLWRGHGDERGDRGQDDLLDFHVSTVAIVLLTATIALQGISLTTINLLKGMLIMPLLCFVIPACLYRGGSTENAADWMRKYTWVVMAVGVAVVAHGPYLLLKHYSTHGHGAASAVPISRHIRVDLVHHETFGIVK